MNSILLTYPGFASLPKGLKAMLVFSETFFFGETKAAWKSAAVSMRAIPFVRATRPRWQAAPTLPQFWRN